DRHLLAQFVRKLLESGTDAILIDCGSGVLSNLAKYGDYTSIDSVLLTHHHLDHVDDLFGLATARWLAGEPETSVVGPPGTSDLVDGLMDAHEYLKDEELHLNVREVDVGSFEIAGIEVTAHVTAHSMYTLAYRFGSSFTFGADSEADEDLIEFSSKSDVLIHDCSFPEGIDVSNHPTPSRLGQALEGHAFDCVYLTHFYPMTNGQHEQMRNAITEYYDGTVKFAQDGMSISV
ncbi:MAG: MBL fold metallo-hydrolase, partial [Halobacteriaceae archaeon]